MYLYWNNCFWRSVYNISIYLSNIKIILDCKLNQIASKVRVIRTVRGLVTSDDCREHCIDAGKCSYFKFKVAFICISQLHFFVEMIWLLRTIMMFTEENVLLYRLLWRSRRVGFLDQSFVGGMVGIIIYSWIMIHNLECKEDSTVNTILKTMKIKSIKSFEDCRNKCQQNVKCDFLNFKVQSLNLDFIPTKNIFRTTKNWRKEGVFYWKYLDRRLAGCQGGNFAPQPSQQQHQQLWWIQQQSTLIQGDFK